MASIFTFDPDPPRVSSPWSAGSRTRLGVAQDLDLDSGNLLKVSKASKDLYDSAPEKHAEGIPSRLEAEPQEGPTEYKLHLLLRPRRSLSFISTARNTTGSRLKTSSSASRTVSESSTGISTPVSQGIASRQHRLEQLTTQLLWRLQQSSSYHSSSATNVILPSLPDAMTELQSPQSLAKLLPGLEDSKGALYEIGVSDDGTFVGLAKDEMEESLTNLRAMAASLGCSITVLRMVQVGFCEWYEESKDDLHEDDMNLRKEKLYVAEAYVKPVIKQQDLVTRKGEGGNGKKKQGVTTTGHEIIANAFDDRDKKQPHVDQLRVSLTGATTCGKSSLLGTLSTSTLDNGRGKSRLSLLKHRHEIASGLTSSVAQELIGYNDRPPLESGEYFQTHVVNYAAGNVTSWDDIHASSDSGRIAFLSDSAGHPRYRRTTVRGLVGWAPHWTLLCIAANDGADSLGENTKTPSDSDGKDTAEPETHISMAHLDLCLRLGLPLVVVITKLDLASKLSIRQVLSAVLTTLKAAGRKPILLTNDNGQVTESDLRTIREADAVEVLRMSESTQQDCFKSVPILFTSAVKGTGMRKLHALLRHLPIPPPMLGGTSPQDENQQNSNLNILFHIDDTFSLHLEKSSESTDVRGKGQSGCIISGLLLHGVVSVGDELQLGPFSTSITHDTEDLNPPTCSNIDEEFLSPRSFSDAFARATSFSRLCAQSPEHEWRRVKINSIRNLRLPSRHLQTDQVGTIGIIAVDDTMVAQPFTVRKGMVLIRGDLAAAHTFTAFFDVAEASSVVVGTIVVVYCASVRASAKVVAISLQESQLVETPDYDHTSEADSLDGFGFESYKEPQQEENGSTGHGILVTFQFLTHREWLEIGSRVLVTPGGGYNAKARAMKGSGGMEGFVGRVVERFG